jgi:hypothetical protein
MSGNFIQKVCPVQISWITGFKPWAPTKGNNKWLLGELQRNMVFMKKLRERKKSLLLKTKKMDAIALRLWEV